MTRAPAAAAVDCTGEIDYFDKARRAVTVICAAGCGCHGFADFGQTALVCTYLSALWD